MCGGLLRFSTNICCRGPVRLSRGCYCVVSLMGGFLGWLRFFVMRSTRPWVWWARIRGFGLRIRVIPMGSVVSSGPRTTVIRTH